MQRTIMTGSDTLLGEFDSGAFLERYAERQKNRVLTEIEKKSFQRITAVGGSICKYIVWPSGEGKTYFKNTYGNIGDVSDELTTKEWTTVRSLLVSGMIDEGNKIVRDRLETSDNAAKIMLVDNFDQIPLSHKARYLGAWVLDKPVDGNEYNRIDRKRVFDMEVPQTFEDRFYRNQELAMLLREQDYELYFPEWIEEKPTEVENDDTDCDMIENLEVTDDTSEFDEGFGEFSREDSDYYMMTASLLKLHAQKFIKSRLTDTIPEVELDDRVRYVGNPGFVRVKNREIYSSDGLNKEVSYFMGLEVSTLRVVMFEFTDGVKAKSLIDGLLYVIDLFKIDRKEESLGINAETVIFGMQTNADGIIVLDEFGPHGDDERHYGYVQQLVVSNDEEFEYMARSFGYNCLREALDTARCFLWWFRREKWGAVLHEVKSSYLVSEDCVLRDRESWLIEGSVEVSCGKTESGLIVFHSRPIMGCCDHIDKAFIVRADDMYRSFVTRNYRTIGGSCKLCRVWVFLNDMHDHVCGVVTYIRDVDWVFVHGTLGDCTYGSRRKVDVSLPYSLPKERGVVSPYFRVSDNSRSSFVCYVSVLMIVLLISQILIYVWLLKLHEM